MKLNRKPVKFGRLCFFLAICLSFSLHAFPQDTNRNNTNRKKQNALPRTTPTPAATPQTLSYLRSRLGGVLANSTLRRGRLGVKIVSLDTGKVVIERNADKYFMPASNMKSYTVATAIDKLTPDFRFVTSVYGRSKPDSNGVVSGDLIVYGRGDPSISGNFYGGDDYSGIDVLADRIVQAGVKRIDGRIIGDETYFNTKPIPYGWEWDDLQWYYGAEISALSLNDNAVTLKITPGQVGSSCYANILPSNRQYRVINRTVTSPKGTKRKLKVTKKLGENVVEISGSMPINDRGFRGRLTVTRPASLFVELLAQRLRLKGVTIRGTSKAVNLEERNGEKLQTSELVEITNLKSPPLSLIAQKTMKPSQNLYTELILRALGEERGDKTDLEKTSEQRGIEIIQSVLASAGAAPESVVQYDASGLSRHNLITPNSAVKLFRYMDKSRYAMVWRNSLTIGGVDGTLKRRFIGTSSRGNVRGKTGTLDQVSALSGYVRSKSGERFAFSILTNNIPSVRSRVSTIDNIVVLLSDFDGKTVGMGFR